MEQIGGGGTPTDGQTRGGGGGTCIHSHGNQFHGGGGTNIHSFGGQTRGGPVGSDDNMDAGSDYSDYSDDDDDFGSFMQWDQVRRPVRRYRRNADHLGPVVGPRLRNRRR